MTFRQWLYRRLFAAEYVAHEKLKSDYQNNVAAHLRFMEELREAVFISDKEMVFRTHPVILGIVRDRGIKLDELEKAEERRKVPQKPARFERYPAMNEEQLTEILAGSGPLPQVKAIIEMIDLKFQQSFDAASDAKLEFGETKFNLGGADWLLKLKADLQSQLEQERKEEAKQ